MGSPKQSTSARRNKRKDAHDHLVTHSFPVEEFVRATDEDDGIKG